MVGITYVYIDTIFVEFVWLGLLMCTLIQYLWSLYGWDYLCVH